MLAKNQRIELNITAMSAEGVGIGRADDGMAVFVPYTAVGDSIRCHIVKVQKTMAFGIVDEVLMPSKHRTTEAVCPAFGKCGGCAYCHVTYEAELQYKWQRVADAISRIGGLSLIPQPIIGCDSPARYRNKAQYPVTAGENGEPRIGFYAARSHRIVEQRDCALQPECFATALKAVERWIKKAKVPLYDEATNKGLLRHIYIREGAASGEVMVCLVCTSGKLPQTEVLITALRETLPGLCAVMVNINRRNTNVVLGEESFVLYGKPYITDVLCGMTFRLSPQSFYQVNRAQAERLYRKAAEAAALTGTETVLDLYCGTGTIGLSMANNAKALIGVEVVEAAVADARLNAAENGIANARFIAEDAAHAAVQLEREGVRPEVVIVDPPRKGCDEALIDTVARLTPDRVVYVSCDPATLARDLKRFAQRGYVTREITPVDMFPRTAHVESVTLIEREKRDILHGDCIFSS